MAHVGEKKKGIMVDINITPLTDVFLVLLIFFMVTATFVLAAQGLSINLPAPNPNQPMAPTQDITVFITDDNRYLVNDQECPKDQLSTRLKELLIKKRENERTVIVKSQKNVLHGVTVEVMDIARGAGALILAIATRPEDMEEGSPSLLMQ